MQKEEKLPKIIIAIDGYSSCGKSTLAKALASKLGYSYIDSGAMYRGVTLYAIQNGLIKDSIVDIAAIVKALSLIHIEFKYNEHSRLSDTYLNGTNVEREIRTMEVSSQVSAVSAIKEVRVQMIKLQRSFQKRKGLVMDGRDIGTDVFPNAELKLFMTADTKVRTQRRVDELTAKGQYVTPHEVQQNLESRDYSDTNRVENPLRKADDAILFDNSDLNQQEQLEYVLKLVYDYALNMHESIKKN